MISFLFSLLSSFFYALFLLLFFGIFCFLAAVSFGSGFLAEITRENPGREREERDRRTTVMRVRCLANTGYELEDADESSLYAIFHFSLSLGLGLGICRKLFSELPRRHRRRRPRPRSRPMFMFTSTGGHRK